MGVLTAVGGGRVGVNVGGTMVGIAVCVGAAVAVCVGKSVLVGVRVWVPVAVTVGVQTVTVAVVVGVQMVAVVVNTCVGEAEAVELVVTVGDCVAVGKPA
mgnify:CR=1 FL=1